MEAQGKSGMEEGGVEASTEKTPTVKEVKEEPAAAPQPPNQTQPADTQDTRVPPQVPSPTPPTENEKSESSSVPVTEPENAKETLPDILGEGTEGKDTSTEQQGSDVLEQSQDSREADHSKDKEPSDACKWVSQGESVLPSMGILPSSEDTPSSPGIDPDKSSSPAAIASPAETRSPEPQPFDPSDVVHKIKKIKWQDIEVPIITQNNNGPCPLLAIVNVMLLKGQITLPTDRTEITGGDLVSVVGNALFDQPRNSLPSEMRRHLEQNTEDAISMLHKLLTGLDVNVKFSGVKDFEFTGELCIFDLLGIMLYHGWVVDPSSEAAAIIKDLSYNQLTNNIFAWREEAIKDNKNDLLVKAMLCEEFMANSGSQLTIHGLFELGAALAREEIAVLFRNNHFSTIYKRGDQLYQLLTDQGFLHENMVWETLNDVDATFSEFVNGNFETITPVPDSSPTSTSVQNMTLQQQINSDQQLAAMLQSETDSMMRSWLHFERLKGALGLRDKSDEEIAKRLQEEENRLAARLAAEEEEEAQASQQPSQQTNLFSSTPTQPPTLSSPTSQQEKKKKDCVIL